MRGIGGGYNCYTDQCYGNAVEMPAGEARLCRDRGRMHQQRCQVSQRLYSQGSSTDVMATCCQYYRMGVDNERGDSPPCLGSSQR